MYATSTVVFALNLSILSCIFLELGGGPFLSLSLGLRDWNLRGVPRGGRVVKVKVEVVVGLSTSRFWGGGLGESEGGVVWS